MRNLNQDNIKQAVNAGLIDAPDERLKGLTTCLVQHLHALARDARLTEAEWALGIDFLTSVGHQCSPARQEFILLSDVLGLSMLTLAVNNDKPQGCTESTVFGPFHVGNAPQVANGDDVAQGSTGQLSSERGRVLSDDHTPLAGASAQVWQTDAVSRCDVQCEDLTFARALNLAQTYVPIYFELRTTVVKAYPVPIDGPVDDLLRATRRHPWRPAHLHSRVKEPGHQTLVSQVFCDGAPSFDSVAMFGLRQSLVAPWVQQADGRCTMDFDFVLNASPS